MCSSLLTHFACGHAGMRTIEKCPKFSQLKLSHVAACPEYKSYQQDQPGKCLDPNHKCYWMNYGDGWWEVWRKLCQEWARGWMGMVESNDRMKNREWRGQRCWYDWYSQKGWDLIILVWRRRTTSKECYHFRVTEQDLYEPERVESQDEHIANTKTLAHRPQRKTRSDFHDPTIPIC